MQDLGAARTTDQNSSIPVVQLYLLHFPSLVIGLLGYASMFFIFRNLSPSAIRDIGFANSYLLLMMAVIVGNIFTISYVLMSVRRGILISAWLNTLLWLKLQHQVTFFSTLAITLLIGGLELYLTFRQRK